jgi:DNA-binding protein H-NS
MSKLATIRKQIAALEAEAERIAKHEMSSAIAKVKEIMATYGLTVEHLGQVIAGKKPGAAKKANAARVRGGSAKYADPKTGKTWSGFGRAPAWLASAKNRDAFLVDKSAVKAQEPVAKAPAAKKKSASKAASAKKVAKPAAKRAAAVAKKAVAAAPVVATKKRSARKAAAKPASKKAARKSTVSNSPASAPAASEKSAPSAT